MGKTPKDKHGVERRRPYNYPRNAQAQTQNYGTESRNYSNSTGNVPRKIPIYHSVPFSGVSGPLPNQAYRFRGGRGYRGRLGGVNKSLKPILNRQRRPDLRNKRVLSPRHRTSARRNMQAETEKHDTAHDETQESSEQVIKNGPESFAVPSEDKKVEGKEKNEEDKGEISENNETCDSNGITNDAGDDPEKVESKSISPSSKEKKAKKGSPATKISSKGKHSPKSKKESKPEPEVEEAPETKETEKEMSHPKKAELELRNCESSSSELQPSVKITRLNALQTDTSDTNDSIIEIPIINDSVIEIPIENQNKSQETEPLTSIDENAAKITVDVPRVKDSPRRSTRLSVRQTPPPKQKISEKIKSKMFEKVDTSSIIVLDSDDSIPALEASRTSQECSFAQSIRSVSGRPSLRPLPAYNRSFNRPSYTAGSTSVRSNVSSRSATTSNDSESDTQETKLTQSRSTLWNKFHSSTNIASQDSATDIEESTNRSCADDSGNDSEATTEPFFEAASNVSFRKRKIEDAEIVEPEQEIKKIRGDSEKNYNSSGLLSIVSSPMSLFASKLRGGKSSTPVQLLKRSDIDDEYAGEDNSIHHDVSEIEYEENILKHVNEKDDAAALSQEIEVEQEANPRRWCSIM